MEIFKKYIRIPKQKITQTTPNHIINIKSTGSTKNYIAYGAKLLINEKLNKIVLKASGNATNKALITADVLMKKIKGLAQINEIKSEEIVDEYQGKTPDLEPLSIKKNLALLEISLSLETNIDKTHYGYQAPLPEEKIKEFGTSFLPKEEKKERNKKNKKKNKLKKYLAKKNKNNKTFIKAEESIHSNLFLLKNKAIKKKLVN